MTLGQIALLTTDGFDGDVAGLERRQPVQQWIQCLGIEGLVLAQVDAAQHENLGARADHLLVERGEVDTGVRDRGQQKRQAGRQR